MKELIQAQHVANLEGQGLATGAELRRTGIDSGTAERGSGFSLGLSVLSTRMATARHKFGTGEGSECGGHGQQSGWAWQARGMSGADGGLGRSLRKAQASAGAETAGEADDDLLHVDGQKRPNRLHNGFGHTAIESLGHSPGNSGLGVGVAAQRHGIAHRVLVAVAFQMSDRGTERL